MDWTPPPMCRAFASNAQQKLAEVPQKIALEGVEQDPDVVYVARPFEPQDVRELTVQDAYHAAGFGRHCVQVARVQAQDGTVCLVHRLRRSWAPVALLAEVSGTGWRVPLAASVVRRDVARMALLDHLLANANRTGFSMLLDQAGGRMLSTDHGQCFGAGRPLEECFGKPPAGDLGIQDAERAEAVRWWLGVEPLVMEALGRWVPQLGYDAVSAVGTRSASLTS